MTLTGNAIPLYRLLALRGAVKLEAVGMKVNRKVNASKIARKELGLKPRAPHAEILAALKEAIEKAHAKLQPGDVTP